MPPHDSPTDHSDMEMSAPAAEPSIVAARRPGARLRLPGFALLATLGLAAAYWAGPVVGTAMGPGILATLLLGALALRIRPERAFILAALTGAGGAGAVGVPALRGAAPLADLRGVSSA